MFARRCVQGLLVAGVMTSLVGCATPSLISIQITPDTETFIGLSVKGASAQFKAIGTYRQGNHIPTTQDITNIVTWQSNAAAVATINSAGVVTAQGSYGSTEITASGTGYTGLIIGTAQVVACAPSATNPSVCGS